MTTVKLIDVMRTKSDMVKRSKLYMCGYSLSDRIERSNLDKKRSNARKLLFNRKDSH